MLDLILSSQNELVDNVKVHEPLGSSDHNQIHFNIKVKTGNTYKKQWRRNFNKGRYKVMRTYLANIDWNNLLKNKTATECWTCLKYEIEGIIEKFIPLRKQGKRSRKKHLSKEAIRKIAHKQMLWKVYKHTGNVEDYTNYKEALNLATTEIRKSKRTFEKKLAGNIKNDSKSFYAYVRSKQKVRDKVGPLENNSENIISDGFQMAEVLNEYFSSAFTTEDISSLPVPLTKFEGNTSEYLGQLFVTPEMIAKKIKKMKDNKSPGVDGIPPKLLKEIVGQISTPLANLFNLSLEEGIVPSEWKEANITPLFKKGSRKKPENYRPVSLTSVVCKLLETLIRDHMVEFLIKHKLINTSQHGFLKARSCLTNILCFVTDKQSLQDDLEKIVKWSEKWQMLFNFGKCKCIHIGHGNMDEEYKMGDAVLGRTTQEKDLGVTFNADMKVSEQCGIAASKGNQILGLIRRTITYKEKHLIVPLYKAIVRPHLEYCIQAWRPYRKKDIDKLERIQRRATKMIPELRDLSYESRLLQCGLTTLETRRLRGDQIEVFKIVNGYEDVDRNMFFKLKEGSRTRGHKAALVKEQCRLDMRKYSFSQRVINEWNKLPNDCVNASSVNLFKNRIDRYMIRAGYT